MGDMPGDNVTDLAVGAIGDDDGGDGRGAVYLLFLTTGGRVKSFSKISSTQGNFTANLDDVDKFGYSVASVGDVSGDGVTDLVVGAIRDDDGGKDRGAVYLLFLTTGGEVNSFSKVQSWHSHTALAVHTHRKIVWHNTTTCVADLVDARGLHRQPRRLRLVRLFGGVDGRYAGRQRDRPGCGSDRGRRRGRW
mmetsp:Transcript_11040/g.25780  ORF Transcript_11040/g.25780 Transcript_11040/m.25780 type:complete len:192 (+) Transcript_11040:383-958(+)